VGTQGWIIGPADQASAPPAPADTSVDLGKGWKIAGAPAPAAPATPPRVTAPQPQAAPPVTPPPAQLGPQVDTSDREPEQHPDSYYNVQPTRLGRNEKGQLVSKWDGGKWVSLFNGAETAAPAKEEAGAPAQTAQPFAGPRQPVPQILAEEPPAPRGAPVRIVAAPKSFVQSREVIPGTARLTQELTDAGMGMTPLGTVASGAGDVGEGLGDLASFAATGVSRAAGVPQQIPAPTGKQVAGAAVKAVKGAVKIGSVLVPYAAMQAPLKTVATLAAYETGQQATEKGLEAVHVPKEYAELAGQFAGLGTGVALGKAAGLFEPGAVFGRPIPLDSLTDQEVMYGYAAAREAGNRPAMELFGREGMRRQASRTTGPEPPKAELMLPAARSAAPGAAAPASPAPPSPEPAPAPPAAPAPAPRDLGDGWTANPIEDHIAEQERAAVDERRGKGPLAEKPKVPVPSPAAQPPGVVEKPQAVTPTPGTRDLGSGWTAVPPPPKREQAPPAAPAKPEAPAPPVSSSPPGIEYRWRETPDAMFAEAYSRGVPIGAATFTPGKDGELLAQNVHVDPEFQRQGVATRLYDMAAFQYQQQSGTRPRFVSATEQTREGKAFRQTYDAARAPAGGSQGEPKAEKKVEKPASGRTIEQEAANEQPAAGRSGAEGDQHSGLQAADGAVRGAGVGRATTVLVPGEDTEYQAQYRLRELSDLQPSHSGFSFQRNPQYPYENDRDYTKLENQNRVIMQAQKSNPRYLITDNPDNTNGPPVVDDRGNALGGNSRVMALQRMAALHPDRWEDYRSALLADAEHYGIDPKDVEAMKQPVLVRETPVSEGINAQRAITDLNKTGTAALGPNEKALMDSRHVSPETLEVITHEIDKLGEGGTLARVLSSDAGPEIVNRLVTDGLITDRERPQYIAEGKLTPEGKNRVGRLMIGRLFGNVAEMDGTPPALRNKLERIVAPLARVEQRPEWDVMSAPIRESMGLMHVARARNVTRLEDVDAQQGLYGNRKFSPGAYQWAGILKNNSGRALAEAFRKYAGMESLSRPDTTIGMFAPPPVPQTDAFEQSFGSLRGAKGAVEEARQPDAGRAGEVRAGEVVPSADSSRVPMLSANRNAGYVPGQSLEFHSRNMVFEPHELDPADQKNAAAVVTNQSGMEYIHRLAGRPQDEGGMSHVASHFSPANAATLANLAKIVKPSQASQQLAGIARAAARAGKSLIVVVDHEGLPDDIKATGLNEELDHRLQSVLAGGKAAKFHLSEAASQRFTQGTPQGRTAAGALGHYGFSTQGEAASEIGVRLMRPGRYRELNLTFPQARSVGADYVRTLRKEYGSVPPREIARRVFDALRHPDTRGGGESDALPGSIRSAGEPGPRGGIEPDSSIRRQPPEKDSHGRSLPRELLPGADAGEPGLFDSSAERQSQVDAQRGADKLTHDRLTAQLKSGGQVKPSNLKPAENRGLFDEEKPESGDLFGSERGSFSPKSTKTPEQVQAARDKQYGQNMREWFTGRRDFWSARVRQITERLRRELPNHIDREGLYLMRDFRNRPGELEQWLDGTHEGYRDVPRIDIARDNIEKMRPAMERAMDPTPAMVKADQELTRVAEVSLREGQRLGFIEHHVSPDEYVTHLLQSQEEQEKTPVLDMLGRAVGGKIGRNFPYNQEREFPTILDAIAHNQRPKTLDALKAFDTYGDKFATARATHMLVQQLSDSDTGIWGSPNGKGMPKGWVPLAAHSNLFKNSVAWVDPEGTPHPAEQSLLVPPKIEKALRPITDPDYLARIPGWTRARNYQLFTKAAQLSLSFFHATAETAMALGNMGVRGYWKGLRADRFSPEFEEAEARYIAHGLTTAIQGNKGPQEGLGATSPLTVSSLPTAAEAIRSTHGIREIDQAAQKITAFTFENQQRRWKVTDMAVHEAAWLAQHPGATRAELSTALRSMAKEVNAVYGGLHWENLGVNKMAVNVARFLQLAPDWWWSNVLNVKYTAEGGPKAGLHQLGSALGGKMPPGWEGSPAGNMARAFWIRTLVAGLLGTQMASLFFSGHLSKRPTQVCLGTDKDGNEIYQNLLLRGAAGQAANTVSNFLDYGWPEGPVRTLDNSASPGLRVYNEAAHNQTFLGREIAPKGMNPIASTVRGSWEAAKGLAPVPWSFSNAYEMLLGADHDKYKKIELLTTLFAGTPPSHVKPPKPEKDAQSVWQQIVTGKTSAAAPRSTKPADPVQQMKREQRKILHP